MTVCWVVLLVLAGRMEALSRDAYVADFEDVVRAYVSERSEDGAWTTQVAGKGARVAYDGVEPLSVTRVGDEAYAGLVRFKSANGGAVRRAEFVAALDGDRWSVRAHSFLGAKAVDSWLPKPWKREKLPASAPPRGHGSDEGAGHAPVAAGESLPDLALVNQEGEPADARKCAKPRCAVIYVEPWEPSSAELVALRAVLESRGLPVLFVVGTNSPQEQLKRARQLGPETLVDIQNRFDPRGGLPRGFLIVDGGGITRQTVLRDFRDVRASADLLLGLRSSR